GIFGNSQNLNWRNNIHSQWLLELRESPKKSVKTAQMRFLNVLMCLIPASQIALAASSVTLTSPANPVILGHPVTLVASINPATATGSVSFYDGTTMVGAAPVVNGQATLSTSLLAPGVRSITAWYLGGTAPASHSAPFSETVNQLPETGFDFQVSYSASNQPGPATTADFNGDGRPDLAVIDDLSVGVLLNKGEGVYTSVVHYPLGAQFTGSATGIAAGDFNADGNADLVVVQNNSIYALLGKGDGTFQTGNTIVVGGSLSAVAIGDFNGDGIADLAVTGTNAGGGVLLGNGDGTFQSVLPLATGSYSLSLVVGDFNKDGKADIAVANADYSYLTNVNTVGVLLGNGDGTFQTTVNYAAGNNLKSITGGDFDGDGKTDLVTVNNSDNAVSVFLGKGDGTFQAQVPYPAGNSPVWAAVGDIDGDGNQDLLVANSNTGDINSPLTMSILHGAGNGTFQAPAGYAVGSNVTSIVLADLNGDGRADVAVAAGFGIQVLRGVAAPGKTTASIALTSSSATPVVYGQSVTLTATLTPSTASGLVGFYDGSALLGDGVISNGIATFSTSLLASGTHRLTAVYSGDTTYAV